MRVLFITYNDLSHEKLGMMYCSAALRDAGHQTRACQISQIAQEIEAFRPRFVALQVISGEQSLWSDVIRQVLLIDPFIRVIVGGPHYTYFKDASQLGAHIVIRGDGEQAMVDAVEGRLHQDMTIVKDIDEIPMPDRDLFYNQRFPQVKNNVIRNFITTRGCIYKCKYCYNSSEEWQKMVKEARLRTHSPQRVVDEITQCFAKYGGQIVSFQDDIFATSLPWLREFVDLYREVKIPFFAQLRPKLITEERVRLLKEAGIHILSFAIESGNEDTRQHLLDRWESNEDIRRGCELLHQYGVKFRMQNLLGLPVKDPLGDAVETLKFNVECKPTLSWCSLLQAYPGTKIADYVVEKGYVRSLEDLETRVNATFFEEGSLPVKDKGKIERLHKYWSAVVRWPWLYHVVTRFLLYVNLGRRIQGWIFNTTKQWINQQEYWRIQS